MFSKDLTTQVLRRVPSHTPWPEGAQRFRTTASTAAGPMREGGRRLLSHAMSTTHGSSLSPALSRRTLALPFITITLRLHSNDDDAGSFPWALPVKDGKAEQSNKPVCEEINESSAATF